MLRANCEFSDAMGGNSKLVDTTALGDSKNGGHDEPEARARNKQRHRLNCPKVDVTSLKADNALAMALSKLFLQAAAPWTFPPVK